MAGRLRTIRDMVVLAVALTLVGAVVVGAVGSDRSADAATTSTHRVTIAPAALIPTRSGTNYDNNGLWLRADGWFTAPIPFHRPGDKVQVRNMTLFAMDNHGGNMCVNLYRTNPATASENSMVQVCSTGSAPGVRSFKASVPPPRNITEFQGGYLWLSITHLDPNLKFYGVRITYRVTE